MKGKGRTILRHCGSVVFMLALVLSVATVSQAKQHEGQHGDPHGGQHGDPHESGKKVKVPEPSTGALLILGSGLTGLAGYCWRRRKRGA
jgi:PEP-CTERM motif